MVSDFLEIAYQKFSFCIFFSLIIQAFQKMYMRMNNKLFDRNNYFRFIWSIFEACLIS